MPEGTVEVELIKGHDLKDVEAFGKSDPFATLSIGGQKHKSKTIHDGGKSPVWNESFLFEIPDGPHELDIHVFDQEKHGSDEAMGSVNIPLIKLFAERQIAPCTYKVQRPNGKFEGELEVGLKFFPKVHHGVLDVHLIEAHGLLDSDSFGKSDPYAVIYCHQEIQKSRILDRTVDPVWNEHFRFSINNEVTEVLIKLFDKDDMRSDDPLGNVVVPLHKVFSGGEVPSTKYKVLGPKGQPQGELSVALRFSSMG
ncbi:hypothetical protein GOP47_0008386 [Adiantum capillus-veneris]|uniref:C2 domain-containing protein n=1 Tax=Adiantum capillus-veneris TaxID=13818 RepID=A0A9D4UYB1_ADICA|nr:hypothetical protein GOP47_0008386 [Adiantum capillus-veneris]